MSQVTYTRTYLASIVSTKYNFYYILYLHTENFKAWIQNNRKYPGVRPQDKEVEPMSPAQLNKVSDMYMLGLVDEKEVAENS